MFHGFDSAFIQSFVEFIVEQNDKIGQWSLLMLTVQQQTDSRIASVAEVLVIMMTLDVYTLPIGWNNLFVCKQQNKHKMRINKQWNAQHIQKQATHNLPQCMEVIRCMQTYRESPAIVVEFDSHIVFYDKQESPANLLWSHWTRCTIQSTLSIVPRKYAVQCSATRKSYGLLHSTVPSAEIEWKLHWQRCTCCNNWAFSLDRWKCETNLNHTSYGFHEIGQL